MLRFRKSGIVKNRNLFASEKIPTSLLMAIVALLILTRLYIMFHVPLFHPSEGRYAEISRNMLAERDWITPQIQVGVPFWGKPPLSFWLNALSISLFGVSKFSVRFPSFLLSVFTSLLTYKMAANLKGHLFGVYSALVLSTTSLFFLMAGAVLTDPILMFSITLSLVSFTSAIQTNRVGISHCWVYCFFAGIALSVLSKGLIGVLFTLSPILVSALWSHEWRNIIKTFPLRTGFLLFVIIAVPWHILMEIKNPGFLNYYFVGEHIKRFLISGWNGNMYGGSHNHYLGMILVYTFVDTMPWSPLLLAAVIWLWKRGVSFSHGITNSWNVFLVAWFVIPIAFFCFAHNTVFTYALPSLPSFAILTVLVFRKVLLKMGMFTQPFRLRDSSEKGVFFLRDGILISALIVVPAVSMSVHLVCKPLLKKHYAQSQMISRLHDVAKERNSQEHYFLGDEGYTMSFYSAGQLQLINHPTRDWIQSHLNNDKIDYYIYDNRRRKYVTNEFLNDTKEIYRMDRYVMQRDAPERKQQRLISKFTPEQNKGLFYHEHSK